MQKKGSLNLSIQAIVIIVIAMTLLGLGLGFVRGLFEDIGGLKESTFQKIQEQMSTDLATSTAPLLFSQTKMNIERGDSKLEGFGVRNDGSGSIDYGFHIETFSCPKEAEDASGCPDPEEEWFTYLKGPNTYTIKAADRQVNKVQIDVGRDAIPGLYLLKMTAYTGEQWENNCGAVESSCDKIGQTELFLTIN